MPNMILNGGIICFSAKIKNKSTIFVLTLLFKIVLKILASAIWPEKETKGLTDIKERKKAYVHTETCR